MLFMKDVDFTSHLKVTVYVSQEEHCFKGYINEEIFGIDIHFTHSKKELLPVIRYLGDQPGNQV